MARRVTALKAYSTYVKEYNRRSTPQFQRKMELVRELARRRPSATPNLTHRIQVAMRYIEMYEMEPHS
jgi:hypothetical protein